MSQTQRRKFLIAAVAFLVAPPVAAQAQKQYRIGLLTTASPGGVDYGPLWRALSDLGYVEGKNLAIEMRWAGGQFERLPVLAAELVALKVDVIVAAGVAIMAAKQATGTIPIVMQTAQDPVATGVVSSLARLGGNITGVTRIATELAGKRLALLKDLLPGTSRVAFLWHDASSPYTVAILRETRAAAAKLGLQMNFVEVKGPEDFASAFAAVTRDRADALVMIQDGLTVSHIKRLVGLAAEHRLPTIYEHSEWAAAGGLMSYGPSYSALLRHVAVFVDKILKGAKPGDLPVEQPTEFEFAINLKTAKVLGISIPPPVLVRADRVIE